MSRSIPCGLSERQYQIALLIMKSHSNKEIASQLGITDNTVHNHIKAAFVKTGAKDRTHLAVMVWWEIEGKGREERNNLANGY